MTAYPIVAPFAGTIIARSAVPSQRAEPTDVLFTLADLSTVRVTANVPESEVRYPGRRRQADDPARPPTAVQGGRSRRR